MNKIKSLVSYYAPIAPWKFVYILQITGYSPIQSMELVLRFPNLFKIDYRGRLNHTAKARALLVLSYCIYMLLLGTVLAHMLDEQYLMAALNFLALPAVIFLILELVIFIGDLLLIVQRKPQLQKARQKVSKSKAARIAVLGSYGKTTMKELLLAVLSEEKKVKATPGNKNIAISHARWIDAKVAGDEDILIFEYGESRPGDIVALASISQPTHAVITGLAPNHLDNFGTLEVLARELASIQDCVDAHRIWCNTQAQEVHRHMPGVSLYGPRQAGSWRISDIKVSINGVQFCLRQKRNVLKIKSNLLGRHQVGPLAAVAAIAIELGVSPTAIEHGIAKVVPYMHRMQPRNLHGAWIIDDTYNGNLEGVRAGLALLSELEASRRIYVTPGLVDQGNETESVHKEIGRLIAKASPDEVVLMLNSVTPFIRSGLTDENFTGRVRIEEDPLSYYTNVEHELAAGDLVLMQNDWPDNYA